VKALEIAERLRRTLPCPLYNVKELKLIVDSIPTREIHEVVDVLLWICPLLEILTIEWRYQETIDNISFKVLHVFIYDAFLSTLFSFSFGQLTFLYQVFNTILFIIIIFFFFLA
jgi:hypothetical protein